MTPAQTARTTKDAVEMAMRWIVLAKDKVVESLKEPDDVPMILEVAFSDGYKTGYSSAHKGAECLVEALERIANPQPFNAGDKIACLLSIEAFTKIAKEALAKYRGEGA